MPIVGRKNFSLISASNFRAWWAAKIGPQKNEHFWVSNDTGIVFLGPNTLRNKDKSMCMGFFKCLMLAWPPLTAHCAIQPQAPNPPLFETQTKNTTPVHAPSHITVHTHISASEGCKNRNEEWGHLCQHVIQH